MTDVQTKLHPFDFGALAKGTWIETVDLEEAAGVLATHPSFQLRVLGLRELIETRTGILSRADGLRLRLMTDSEAVQWSIRQAADASRKLDRTARRLQENIDRSQLIDSEKIVHEHATRVISLTADAQRAERQKAARLFASVPQQLTDNACGDNDEATP